MHNIINERIPNFMVEGGGGKPYEGIDVYLLMIQTDIDYNQDFWKKLKLLKGWQPIQIMLSDAK
jgi:hypothetical protein